MEEECAWRTFCPLNQLLLSPGDTVEIISSGPFDQSLMPMGEGTADNPIKIHFAEGRYDFSADIIVKNTNGDVIATGSAQYAVRELG